MSTLEDVNQYFPNDHCAFKKSCMGKRSIQSARQPTRF